MLSMPYLLLGAMGLLFFWSYRTGLRRSQASSPPEAAPSSFEP